MQVLTGSGDSSRRFVGGFAVLWVATRILRIVAPCHHPHATDSSLALIDLKEAKQVRHERMNEQMKDRLVSFGVHLPRHAAGYGWVAGRPENRF